jgi:hypothetical protein
MVRSSRKLNRDVEATKGNKWRRKWVTKGGKGRQEFQGEGDKWRQTHRRLLTPFIA